MSFQKMKIGRDDVQKALEVVKSGILGRNSSPSRNTYIQCPIDKTLWDHKAVIGLLWESADEGDRPREWVTTTDERALSELGFVRVKFKHQNGRRVLGINGCNPSELLDPHTVFWPDGREEHNGFAPKESHVVDREGRKTTILVNQHVRNSQFKQDVLDAANGVCDACEGRSFQKLNGEWFLEVHHRKWLSEGGLDIVENMVALCPNCHRQEHHGCSRRYF